MIEQFLQTFYGSLYSTQSEFGRGQALALITRKQSLHDVKICCALVARCFLHKRP
jgi:hypothetical protein